MGDVFRNGISFVFISVFDMDVSFSLEEFYVEILVFILVDKFFVEEFSFEGVYCIFDYLNIEVEDIYKLGINWVINSDICICVNCLIVFRVFNLGEFVSLIIVLLLLLFD